MMEIDDRDGCGGEEDDRGLCSMEKGCYGEKGP